jgi:hypothetical protein
MEGDQNKSFGIPDRNEPVSISIKQLKEGVISSKGHMYYQF